ncbi:Biotin/lipoyl attachment [Penicillium desertorum]|uniref:dihydrolipoyllysine-residue succinyltransferase n=1 Tax=Penicillium desertorum TaxID=1303715 RepID=A0A9W9WS14_9EURO|nr:Biotin/lipoyl attachment [Penicillium desertorum]
MASRISIARLSGQRFSAVARTPRASSQFRNVKGLSTLTRKTSARSASGLLQVSSSGINVSRLNIAPLGGHQLRTYADSIIKVPSMAESITEGTLKQFSKQVGDFVERDEEIATIETDKIDVSDLVKLELGAAPEGGKKDEGAEKPKEPEPRESEPKRLRPPKEAPKAESKPQAAEQPALGDREERRVKMNRMRLRIAERLKQSQNTAASLTTFNEVDMSSLMEFRKLYKDDVLKKTGVKLGFMSAFSRACVLAMKDIPAVNASIEGPNGGDTIVYRDYVDISVAVATEKGLVTPVVRNTEGKDLVGIEKAIADLGKKARDNKLTIEDMAGGTFTISNGGVFGSLMGTPIINVPQTAVLGLHAIKDKPVAVNGRVEIRPMMYLALTYDHRLLDGREAVTFLVKVKEYIEDPRRMLLG